MCEFDPPKMVVLIKIEDDVLQAMAAVSCTGDADEHCRPHMMVRKEQTVGSVLGSCENRVSVSCAGSLRNCPGFALGISISDRVWGVSIATSLLAASNQSVLYTSFYVLPYDDEIVIIHALLVLSLP